MGNAVVSVEINGKQQRVGMIVGDSYQNACFQYAKEFLDLDGIVPISVNLPLKEEPFSRDETEAFFEGLLPEGFSRKAVANWAKADARDYLTILKQLGQECLGAIQVSEEGTQVPAGSYELLTTERVKALAAEGATTSTALLVETHLSLTGASGKVGLYYDEEHDDWYLPIGNCASTHIVKQSHVRLEQLVLNEQLCIKTARKIGITVPDSFIINTGNAKDEDVLYATKRYDREMSDDLFVNGLKMPHRLHQEDFAQALGIHATKKYETEKQGYLRRMFDLIRKYSTNPMEDQLKLWDQIVFDYLIGNTDCHVKNFSLLYDPSFRKIRLSPAYDIVCTCAYNSSKEMSFFIGDDIDIRKINRQSFQAAAREVGLGQRLAMRRFDDMADKFENAVREAAVEVDAAGFPDAKKFGQRILDVRHNAL